MATQQRFTINGLVDTKQTALQNLETICTSAGSWLTFDNQTGNWSVIINQSGNSVSSFNDSNILNGIRMNGSGLRDLYNGVRVTYPRSDIRDNTDFVQIDLPQADWNPGEVENLLEISLPLVNTQVQAQLIGFRELKQSRVDRIIEFQTDYSKLGVKAGDIIDVTNTALGLSANLYRIINVVELDDIAQGLTFQITALEYDANVYNEDDLVEYVITTENGIVAAGDIAQPAQPQITKYDKDGRPRLEIETVVPAGRVEEMEYWLTTGNVSSNYTLVGTQKSTSAGALTEGTEIVLDLDNINAANVYVKTRGINSQTSGPFSNVSALVSFQPVQVTDAIGNNTSLLDSAGTPIALLLGLNTLLKGVDTFMGGNATAFNSTPKSDVSTLSVSNANCVTKLQAMTAGYTQANGYVLGNVTNPANWMTVSFSLSKSYSSLKVDIQTPNVVYDYDYLDQDATVQTGSITAQPPVGVTLQKGANTTVGLEVAGSTVDWNSNYTQIILSNVTAGTYWVSLYALQTFALNMYWPRSLAAGSESTIWPYNYSVNPSGTPQGFNVLVTATNFG
jgi:hypothetical protein